MGLQHAGQLSPRIDMVGVGPDHLIQVLGRRESEGSVSQQMDLARQAIGQRKAEQAYADWLRELRDTAYVDVKIGKPNLQ